MDNEIIVESVKNLCKDNNITVSQLEKEIGLSQGLVSKWMNTTPSLDKIMDIANYFHVSLDEVVGYSNVINDKFLEKLISQTTSKFIKWSPYNNEKEDQPKQYFSINIRNYDFLDQNDINDFFETNKEISYYYKVNNGYISIYGYYQCHDIINPKEIKLFIQPNYEAGLIEQDYSYEQLKSLWLKILYTIGTNAPDEIKAEEFKNSFINDFQKPMPPKKKIRIVIPEENNMKRPPNARPIRLNNTKPASPIKPLTPPTQPSSVPPEVSNPKIVPPNNNKQ